MQFSRLLAALVILLGALGSRAGEPTKSTEPTKPTGPKWPEVIDGRNLDQWVRDLTHQDPSVREEAIRAIVNFGPAACTTPIIKTLISRTLDHDAVVRTRAVMALTVMEIKKSDIPAVVKALGHLLENDSQSVVRYQAAVGLVRYADDTKPVLAALVRGTSDSGAYSIRQMSLVALAHAASTKDGPPDIRAIQAMAGRLSDSALAVKLEAMRSLAFMGKIGDQFLQSRVEQLLRGLTTHRDKVVVIWAWIALMGITEPNPEITKAIGGFLRNPEVRIRIAAAQALGQMGKRAQFALPDLLPMLKDKEPHVVLIGIWAIAQVEAEKPRMTAINALTEVSKAEISPKKEWNDYIHQYAESALKVLTKKD
jgi:HEAT repeat protein